MSLSRPETSGENSMLGKLPIRVQFRILRELRSLYLCSFASSCRAFAELTAVFICSKERWDSIYDNARLFHPAETADLQIYTSTVLMARVLRVACATLTTKKKLKILQKAISHIMAKETTVSDHVAAFFHRFCSCLSKTEHIQATDNLLSLTGYEKLRKDVLSSLPGQKPEKEMELRQMHAVLYSLDTATAKRSEKFTYLRLTYHQQALMLYITLGPVVGDKIYWAAFQYYGWKYDNQLDAMVDLAAELYTDELFSWEDVSHILEELTHLPSPWHQRHIDCVRRNCRRRNERKLVKCGSCTFHLPLK